MRSYQNGPNTLHNICGSEKNCPILFSYSFYYLQVTDEIGKRKKSAY